jgi:alkylation response protein AidB-like acyl-CoA dehydrogenase
MLNTTSSSFIDAAKELAPQIRASAEEIEQSRRLPQALVEAMAHAGLFHLWIPRSLGGEETDPFTFFRVIEEISKADGAAGWCVALCGGNNVFAGYLPADAAREIYGDDPNVRTAGAFRPSGEATIVDGGYRVTGRWPLASGCQHSNWIVGGCRILDGDQPRLGPDGDAITRILFFSASECEIIDTWHSIGLRGTGSHDFAVDDVFVPATHSLSFREPPVELGPLYALPTIALFSASLAAVPLGIAGHAIEILMALAGTKIASRSRQSIRDDAILQANLGRAEALVRSGRAYVREALGEAWEVVKAGQTLTVAQRAALWLAGTHAANTAKEAVELMFSAGGSASPYTSCGLERCVRDIHAAAQHIILTGANYQMVGQALLGADMRKELLLALDDRSGG